MELQNLFSVKGKIVLVTGGSRGIGEWIAEGFVTNGAKVYICSRKKEACDKLAQSLNEIGKKKGNGGSCISLPGDLSEMTGLMKVVNDFKAKETQLDVLINNAGIAWGAEFEQFDEKSWNRVLDLNLKSVFFLTQQLSPLLKQSGKVGLKNADWPVPAKVINIASIDGLSLNVNENFPYPASKAGLIHLTRVLAKHLAQFNIHVTCIAPGAFGTVMNKVARDAADVVKQGIPAHRVGQSFDMAGAALFLASRAGDYVVGSTVVVDGGVANATPPAYPIKSILSSL